MRNQNLIAITIIALGMATPLRAQQHQGNAPTGKMDMAAMMCGGGMAAMPQMHGAGMPGMPMDHMESMMGPPSPGMILEQKEKLGLSAAQVSRLEALQKQAQPQCTRHMQLAMNTHMAASQLLEAATPNFNAFEAKLKEATAHMVEGHVAMAKAAVAARAVLTPAQRETLKNQKGMKHDMH